MRLLLILSICIFLSLHGFSQGCSDAGFCSLGVLKNNVPNQANHNLSFGSNYGLGEASTSTINPYLEYVLTSNERFSYSTKLTSVYATGFLGSAFSIGDFYINATYKAKTTADNSLSFLGGFKIPLSSSNEKNGQGKPLPMDYQASIGTYDIIGGINYIIQKSWEFDAGFQAPIHQNNKNSFFPDEYADPNASKFSATNGFRRHGDLLGRVGYYIPLTNNFLLKPSLLGVYHLANDSYEDKFGAKQVIDGSQGITLNGALTAQKTFSNKSSLEVILATPFHVRRARPDGLTRDLVINLQYTIAW